MRLYNVESWLASLVIRSEGTYGRGTAVGPEGRRWWKDSDRGTKSLPRRACERGVLRLRLSAVQELPRTQGGAFFFTKKAYCVNQTACVAESRKSVQTQPPLFRP